MSVYKRRKMFFHNTLVAHKQTKKPYFMGFEVHKEIGKRNIKDTFQSPKQVCFGDFATFCIKYQ